MAFDYEATLIGYEVGQDDIGNSTSEKVETIILCKKRSIRQSEFYAAAQSGLKPELTLVVRPYEYNNQKEIVFEEVSYRIIRTFEIDSEELELICEVQSGG